METIVEKLGAKGKIVLIGVVACCLVLVAGFFFFKPSPKQEEVLPSVLFSQQVEAEEAIEPIELDQPILVDVKGAVVREGVYELSAGSRVTDAIKLAGGFLDDAEPNSINLAQKLTDEMVIYVAFEGEEGLALSQQTAPASAMSQNSKVNINTADLSQLQTISGIGEKKAKDIISYRETNGRFQTIDELTQISGIGAKTLDKIREEISLD